ASSSVYFHWSVDHRDSRSVPTRRSSDLGQAEAEPVVHQGIGLVRRHRCGVPADEFRGQGELDGGPGQHSAQQSRDGGQRLAAPRSEEHTSELQSRENLVCRLLLEKKKRI